jgi:hypothetical protein
MGGFCESCDDSSSFIKAWIFFLNNYKFYYKRSMLHFLFRCYDKENKKVTPLNFTDCFPFCVQVSGPNNVYPRFTKERIDSPLISMECDVLKFSFKS